MSGRNPNEQPRNPENAARRAAAIKEQEERKKNEAKDSKVAAQPNLGAIPDGFEDPISKDIMEDPVSALDGHAYERKSIEAWFATGRRRSPMTGQNLITTALIPNHSLRKAIQDWKKRQPALENLLKEEQMMQDLRLAIALREQDMEEQYAKPLGEITPERLIDETIVFVTAVDNKFKSSPDNVRFYKNLSSAAGYVGTVLESMRKDPKWLEEILKSPGYASSIPEPIAKFVQVYLATHPNLHHFRSCPDLAKSIQVKLSRSATLEGALTLDKLIQNCLPTEQREQKESNVESKQSAGNSSAPTSPIQSSAPGVSNFFTSQQASSSSLTTSTSGPSITPPQPEQSSSSSSSSTL